MKLAILISALLLAACVQANTSKPSAQAEEPTEAIPPTDNQVMCTMDAMQCADGSWVGRSGPNCEFVCPAATDK
jgi:PBP1b-binding outer membrane lipoprotein LpoB